VHYAPEITLNILSINLLKQQGFDIIFEGDRCTREYMFKNQQGQNMDVDKMRQRHNDYLDDYFESLDKERVDREGEVTRMEDHILVLCWHCEEYMVRPYKRWYSEDISLDNINDFCYKLVQTKLHFNSTRVLRRPHTSLWPLVEAKP
nr:ARID DNA-binding domain-containing protein [Tanacetum cinerariifolium]